MFIRWNTDCGAESDGFTFQVTFEPIPVPGAHTCETVPRSYCPNYDQSYQFNNGVGGAEDCRSGCEADPDCTGGYHWHGDGVCYWFGVAQAQDHECANFEDCGDDCTAFVCE